MFLYRHEKTAPRLLSATAIERMAVITGVTFTGMHGYKTLAAMGKTLEHDGSNRILRKQEGGRAHKTDKQLFHTILPCLNAAHCTAVVPWRPRCSPKIRRCGS